MGDQVQIRKGEIYNVVSRGAYESIYKSKGWLLVGEAENKQNHEFEVKGIVDENVQNAYVKAKREETKRHFNDDLFKGD